MVESVSRGTGLSDKPPEVAYVERAIIARLQDCLEDHGYRLVETPVLERSELFQRKSGEEWAGRLFSFEYRGQRLCLRPEFTASISRFFVERLQALPKPLRLQTVGPVFRHESHGRSRSRQFTMVGAELIGAGGFAADAEIIAIAWEGLQRLGLGRYRLVVGHVGLLSEFLTRLGLDGRACRFVLGHMEDLRKPERGAAYVRERLRQLYSGPSAWEDVMRGQAGEFTRGGEQEVSEEQIGMMLDLVYASDGTERVEGRTREEIAARLHRKLRRAGEMDGILRALDFAGQLGHIQCPPEEALERTRAVLDSFGLDESTLVSLQKVVEMLGWLGIPAERMTVDMGMGRGLHYYTGIVFEIHAEDGGADSQLCGGGRYDDLLRVLGANQDVPAIGFAYGVERVRRGIEEEEREEVGRLDLHASPMDILVIPITEAEMQYAVEVSLRLRRELCMRVELQLKPGSSLGTSLAQANRRDILLVVLVGEDEARHRTITIRYMADRKQLTIPLDEVSEKDFLGDESGRISPVASHGLLTKGANLA
ncbi:MAG: histidine--tRNA ligase family protein [Anaerolineae bacterium]|nr:histidine--tRNA ligase family protein [Anaerolineae bacterium]